MQAFEEDVAKYKGKYDRGYEPARKARYEWAERFGLINPKWQLSPQAGDWEAVKDKRWEARCMEVYAAMVTAMDANVGRIVAELKRTGQLDNTLILFLQDNGGCAEATGRTGNADHPNIPRPEKPTKPVMKPVDLLPSGSIPLQTRDGYPVRMGPKVLPGADDTYVAYGKAWANVSNTPFREYKHWVHEGGISTPLIAHWPAGIQAKGELRTQPGHLIDVMATCLDVAGTTFPETKNGHHVLPPEGKSLVPAFANKPIDRDAIYWEHEGNRAIRVGDWKLVAKGPGAKWELYDMAADRTELHDLASGHADTVTELRHKWEAWAERANVLPWIWTPPYTTGE
jgi:arylsulfatase A-like enzyme